MTWRRLAELHSGSLCLRVIHGEIEPDRLVSFMAFLRPSSFPCWDHMDEPAVAKAGAL